MSNRKAIAGVIAVAVLTALVLPIVFGHAPTRDDEHGGDPWRNWIYDFQTLITGLAAVGAATWTISVMEKTDARQETRHRELVALSQRGDLRRLSRAIDPQLEELYAISERLQSLNLDKTRFTDQQGDPLFRMISDVAMAYRMELHSIQSLLARPQFVDGSELFGGRLTYELLQLNRGCEYLLSHLDRHIHADTWEDASDSQHYENEFDDFGNWLETALSNFRRNVGHVADGLKRTKEEFEL